MESKFSLGVHTPALSGSWTPFTKYSKPSWVTRWPTTTTLLSVLSMLTSVDRSAGGSFDVVPLVLSFFFVSSFFCVRLQPKEQGCTLFVLKRDSFLRLSAVQRQGSRSHFVNLLHSTNFYVPSIRTTKVTHFRCFFLQPWTFLDKGRVIFVLRVHWDFTLIFMLIAGFPFALKSQPHCGFHCTFQCTS